MAENHEAEARYFDELAIRLQAAGFTPKSKNLRGQIPVEWKGKVICEVADIGCVIYKSEDMEDGTVDAARNRITDIAGTVAEYMRLMEQAPQLKVSGLEGDYRILADFNNTVLAGHPTRHGVTFVTWDWDFNHKGLSHGHYFEGGYREAKEDFAVRCGLVPRDVLLSQKRMEPSQSMEMGGMT